MFYVIWRHRVHDHRSGIPHEYRPNIFKGENRKKLIRSVRNIFVHKNKCYNSLYVLGLTIVSGQVYINYLGM